MKILFATSEVHPLIKTGGLADVSGSLPIALKTLGHDIRILLPAYSSVLEKITHKKIICRIKLAGYPEEINILEYTLPNTTLIVYLVDAPTYFNRPGKPYTTPDGYDWIDNADRFTLFSKIAATIALNQTQIEWQPDIVHANDWQTGLIPALLATEESRPGTLFTIHNLAYQGLYSYDTFKHLNLPQHLWSMHSMEFHGQLSFIKGGLTLADKITTVSPTYAREIKTSEYGYGLQKLLRQRSVDLTGIINGVDYSIWNPEDDPHIKHNYSHDNLENKVLNKRAIQQHFNLPETDVPMLSFIGRLVDQKGVNLILHALPKLLESPVQIVLLGSGDLYYEEELNKIKQQAPDKLALLIGYDEELAHLIQAGSDMLLMPSKYEPCGLNQLYSLKYGTIPIVRRTGGLVDTVIDTSPRSIKHNTATGFIFDESDHRSLTAIILKANHYYTDKKDVWNQLIINAMKQDYSWEISAIEYVDLYEQALIF
ncbi:MAG: glycogen synthase GlgA [Methylococcales bacterium]|jgi:starch synthase|nr:glycogen synthase GlgA [Methylococcales bacterium]MBT7409585.1 glycogen synthase GlgA [Methylococcales bacterium]